MRQLEDLPTGGTVNVNYSRDHRIHRDWLRHPLACVSVLLCRGKSKDPAGWTVCQTSVTGGIHNVYWCGGVCKGVCTCSRLAASTAYTPSCQHLGRQLGPALLSWPSVYWQFSHSTYVNKHIYGGGRHDEAIGGRFVCMNIDFICVVLFSHVHVSCLCMCLLGIQAPPCHGLDIMAWGCSSLISIRLPNSAAPHYLVIIHANRGLFAITNYNTLQS